MTTPDNAPTNGEKKPPICDGCERIEGFCICDEEGEQGTGWTVDEEGLLVPPSGGSPMSSTWLADALDVSPDDGYALVRLVARAQERSK